MPYPSQHTTRCTECTVYSVRNAPTGPRSRRPGIKIVILCRPCRASRNSNPPFPTS